MRNSKTYLCGPLRISAFSAFEIALLTQRTPRYAEGRRVLERGAADALEIGAVRV